MMLRIIFILNTDQLNVILRASCVLISKVLCATILLLLLLLLLLLFHLHPGRIPKRSTRRISKYIESRSALNNIIIYSVRPYQYIVQLFAH